MVAKEKNTGLLTLVTHVFFVMEQNYSTNNLFIFAGDVTLDPRAIFLSASFLRSRKIKTAERNIALGSRVLRREIQCISGFHNQKLKIGSHSVFS